ncbi:MAG TPA: 2-phospho-L-lactate transferase [Candidatus Cybelea sp.]|nr:2-phospho-L-lactate transferase [Candidatus Cybelea sp.]
MIVALAGGVGGAKLADGLAHVLGRDLAVVVNTADDFEHIGLHVSPDIDTVMYTLGGVANAETGWGVAGESWNFLDQLSRLDGPTWFRLGDRDLATHVLRNERLKRGERLTAITGELCRRLGISARVLPMSDDPVRTVVHTAEGPLAFQEYFVGRRCEVPVTGFTFAGIENAQVTKDVQAALSGGETSAVVICPSNPFVSIDPILHVPGMRALLLARDVPIVAVSPIIGGAAVKGPAAKMMRELGLEASSKSVAAHYRGLIEGLMLDHADAPLSPAIESMGMKVRVTDTLMKSATDRRRLAQECLDFAAALARPGASP